jgi:uncharacterized protein DUF6968
MKFDSVGEVIASRKLSLVRDDQEPAEVEVSMGKPMKFPDYTDYYCPYEIKGLGRGRVKAAGGIDAFQAIQLALGTIAVELEVLEKESSGKLSWDAGEPGDLGIPERDSKKE